MGAMLCACSDSVKDVNEDGICILSAMIGRRFVILAVVCDGVGGLPDGEWASSYCVAQMIEWFCQSLPGLMSSKRSFVKIRRDMKRHWEQMNQMLYQKKCGSTCSIWLGVNHHYQVFHVGDSRIYRLHKKLDLLTTDHRLPESNILWQCIGCGHSLKIQYKHGRIRRGDIFLLGTDGLFGRLNEAYLCEEFEPSYMLGREELKKGARHLFRLIRKKGERDDATLGMISF